MSDLLPLPPGNPEPQPQWLTQRVVWLLGDLGEVEYQPVAMYRGSNPLAHLLRSLDLDPAPFLAAGVDGQALLDLEEGQLQRQLNLGPVQLAKVRAEEGGRAVHQAAGLCDAVR
jgi:hypothetical protein